MFYQNAPSGHHALTVGMSILNEYGVSDKKMRRQRQTDTFPVKPAYGSRKATPVCNKALRTTVPAFLQPIVL